MGDELDGRYNGCTRNKNEKKEEELKRLNSEIDKVKADFLQKQKENKMIREHQALVFRNKQRFLKACFNEIGKIDQEERKKHNLDELNDLLCNLDRVVEHARSISISDKDEETNDHFELLIKDWHSEYEHLKNKLSIFYKDLADVPCDSEVYTKLLNYIYEFQLALIRLPSVAEYREYFNSLDKNNHHLTYHIKIITEYRESGAAIFDLCLQN